MPGARCGGRGPATRISARFPGAGLGAVPADRMGRRPRAPSRGRARRGRAARGRSGRPTPRAGDRPSRRAGPSVEAGGERSEGRPDGGGGAPRARGHGTGGRLDGRVGPGRRDGGLAKRHGVIRGVRAEGRAARAASSKGRGGGARAAPRARGGSAPRRCGTRAVGRRRSAGMGGCGRSATSSVSKGHRSRSGRAHARAPPSRARGGGVPDRARASRPACRDARAVRSSAAAPSPGPSRAPRGCSGANA